MASPPSDERRSVGVLTDGTLDVRRVSFVGTWQGAGTPADADEVQWPFPGTGIALYTDSWGPTTPDFAGATAAFLFPPRRDPEHGPGRAGRRVADRRRRRPDPAGRSRPAREGRGRDRAERGSAHGPTRDAAAPLQARLAERRRRDRRRAADRPRQRRRVQGRGALLDEPARSARAASAIGQLADGRIVLVAVDGGQPGYSVGMTNFELAQTLVRLGAVTGWRSTAAARRRWRSTATCSTSRRGPERAISTALEFQYSGVYVQPAVAVVSPDGDGVGDKQTLRYKPVRPSTVTVRLTSPEGKIAYEATVTKQPGSYGVAFPPAASPPVTPLPVTPSAGDSASDDAAADHPGTSDAAACADHLGPDDGRRQGDSDPHAGQVDAHRLRHRRRRAAVGDGADVPRQLDGRVPRDGIRTSSSCPTFGRDLHIRWKQTKAASVVVTVETRAGEVVRMLAKRRYAPGSQGVTWNGLDRTKKAVKGGWYAVRVVAVKPARDGRPQPSRARATDRRRQTLTTVRRCSSPRSRAR